MDKNINSMKKLSWWKCLRNITNLNRRRGERKSAVNWIKWIIRLSNQGTNSLQIAIEKDKKNHENTISNENIF
jgi:hypothetical protein